MRHLWAVLVLLSCFMGFGLQAQPSDSQPSAEAALTALRAADTAYQRAARIRDREAFHALLSADAIFLGSQSKRGRIDYVASWLPLFEGKYNFRYKGEHLDATVAESGELAWTLGNAETRFTPPGGEENVIANHYMTVWAKSGDDWKVVVSASLVVHPELGSARDPRTGLMTSWPELADQIDAAIEIEWIPETTVRAASGELAYSFGEYRAQFRSLGVTHAGKGAYVAVWEKDEAGQWQLAAEGFTPPEIHAD